MVQEESLVCCDFVFVVLWLESLVLTCFWLKVFRVSLRSSAQSSYWLHFFVAYDSASLRCFG